MMSPHATTFLFSSSSLPPDSFFQGYCFSGTDYIFSDSGKREYEDSTGIDIVGGLDGCYAIVRRDGDGFVFSNDFSGYKVLYYYHDGETWVVSNSFAQTVDFLRSAGITVTPNYAQLSAVNSKISARSQLVSLNTTVQGVSFAPRGAHLIVTPTHTRVQHRAPTSGNDYAEGLTDHLDLWVGRFETLLIDGRVGVTTDLTGGVDSRTNFALLTKAKQRLRGKGSDARLSCGSTPGNTKDLEVATQLTEYFGVPLNDDRRFDRLTLSPQAAVETFRSLQAGVAYTLYMPVESPTPFNVSFGGGGGEVHRRFYERPDMPAYDSEALIKYGTSRLHHSWLAPDLANQARKSLDQVTRDGEDPLRAHYREFRHRFHSGRSPRYGVAFTPLDSHTAAVAQARASQEYSDAGQFNYDIIASLSYELLNLPYDDERKAPNAEAKSRLTRVEVPAEARPGRVWAPTQDVVTQQVSDTARTGALRDLVESAIADPFVSSFWGQSVVNEARALLDKLANGQGIGNAVNGLPISALLAAHISSPTH